MLRPRALDRPADRPQRLPAALLGDAVHPYGLYTLNRVDLIGNLGRDPETREFPNGGEVTSLSLATSEKWKDRQTGEVREKTEWHRVEVK